MNNFIQKNLKWILCLLLIIGVIGIFLPQQMLPAPGPRYGVATTYYVATTGNDSNAGTSGSPWKTISHAITAATAGDIIDVYAGTYNGSLTVNKALTIQRTGSGSVIIDGQQQDSGASVSGGLANGGAIEVTAVVTLNNLTIQDSWYNDVNFASGSAGSTITNCNILNWGIQSSGHTTSVQSSGIQMQAGTITISYCYFQRSGSNPHNFIVNNGGMDVTNYNAEYQNWAAITACNSSGGGHTISNNYVDGGYMDYFTVNTDADGAETYTVSGSQHYVPSTNDGITDDQWLVANHAYDSSTISGNTVVGCWDDNIEVIGYGITVGVTDNFVDGVRYSRACMTVVGLITGTIHVGTSGHPNTFKNWNNGNQAIKNGAYGSGGAGTKYVEYNLIWSDISHQVFHDTNSTSSGNYWDYNTVYTSDGTMTGTCTLATNTGNNLYTYTSLAEPTTPPHTTPTPTPTPPTPGNLPQPHEVLGITAPLTTGEIPVANGAATGAGDPNFTYSSGTLTVPSIIANGQYYSVQYTTTVTLDWNNGNCQYIVLANGDQTFTFANPVAGGRYLIILKQPASGAAGTVTWPGTVLWASDTSPTLTATNGQTDIATFIYDGTNSKYYGEVSLNH